MQGTHSLAGEECLGLLWALMLESPRLEEFCRAGLAFGGRSGDNMGFDSSFLCRQNVWGSTGQRKRAAFDPANLSLGQINKKF